LLLVMQAKDESTVRNLYTNHFAISIRLTSFIWLFPTYVGLFSFLPLTAIETRVRSRHSYNIQLKAMLPTNGRTGQLHALKTYVIIPPQLP
jgi:hypothetical protein